MTTKTTRREEYRAASLFVNNAPNIWAVLKRATPEAREFNGEVLAHCKDEATARQLVALLNAAPATLAALKEALAWNGADLRGFDDIAPDQEMLKARDQVLRAAISRAEVR